MRTRCISYRDPGGGKGGREGRAEDGEGRHEQVGEEAIVWFFVWHVCVFGGCVVSM